MLFASLNTFFIYLKRLPSNYIKEFTAQRLLKLEGNTKLAQIFLETIVD